MNHSENVLPIEPHRERAPVIRSERTIGAILAPLDIEIVPQSELGIPEAEEPHATFVENALAKARHASRLSGCAAFSDDSGICVAALGGKPGVHSARYASEDPADVREVQDGLNNRKLVAQLAGVADRRAHYYCVIVLVRDPDDPEPLAAHFYLFFRFLT